MQRSFDVLPTSLFLFVSYYDIMDHWSLLADSDSVNMGDTESCNSGILNSGWNHRCPKQRQKVGVYNEVLCRLKELNVPEAVVPGFEDDLWAHFYRLPARHTESSFLVLFTVWLFIRCFSVAGDHFRNLSLELLWIELICCRVRYALDMNVERAEEVLMHKRLLDIAGGPTTAIGPAIEVRLVQVIFEITTIQWPPNTLYLFIFTTKISFDFLYLLSPSWVNFPWIPITIILYSICLCMTHYWLLALGDIVGEGTNVTLPLLQRNYL